MPTTVFFSWQADHPQAECKRFIDGALRQAVHRLSRESNVEDAVRDLTLDRDTSGIPGTPPIVETIFRKISQAAVFVPDLSYVAARADKRSSPNPNVLIELGWALRSLGHSRIVPVMNVAYGKPTADALPFDLQHLRHPILYECRSNTDSQARKNISLKLAAAFEKRLKNVFSDDELNSLGGWWVYALRAHLDDEKTEEVVGIFKLIEAEAGAEIREGEAFFIVEGKLSSRGRWSSDFVKVGKSKVRSLFHMETSRGPAAGSKSRNPFRYEGILSLERTERSPLVGSAVFRGYFQDIDERATIKGPVYAEKLKRAHSSNNQAADLARRHGVDILNQLD